MKKNVIITGAAGNLGKAAVQRFLREGYRVIATVAPGEEPAFESLERVDTHEVNLLNEADAGQFIQATVQTHKTIDAALLLVGGYVGGDIAKATGEQVKKMISLNFDSAYNCARPVFMQMLRQATGGRIVLVGARPALEAKAGKGSLAYSLSKSMLFKLAELLNAEAEGKNIVTSVIVPSTIDTPANRKSMPDADFSRWVKPEKIADVLAFLVSSQAQPLVDPIVKVYGNPE